MFTEMSFKRCEEIVKKLIDVHTTLGKLDTLKFEDYFFTQKRLRNHIQYIKDSCSRYGYVIGMDTNKPNSSWKYIKNG